MKTLMIAIFSLFIVFPIHLVCQISNSFNSVSVQHQKGISTMHFANTWPSENAEWYYEIQPMGGCFPCYVSFQNLKTQGDTIIQSKNCRILQRLNSLSICDNMGSVNEFIYQSNDTVFWYNKTLEEFTILYNFKANAGDSWEIFVNNCSFIVDVEEIDSVQLNGSYYNRLHISDENDYFTGTIIANIGHTTSFFPRNIFWECEGFGCDSDFIDGLRCYMQNDTLIYKRNTDECDTSYLITGIQKPIAKRFIVYPIPTGDYLNINTLDSFNNSNSVYYNLLNTKGQIVKRAKLTNSTRIYVGNLIPGIYLFQLIDETSTLLFENIKIIKL